MWQPQFGSSAERQTEVNNYSLQVLCIGEIRWTEQGQFCSEGLTNVYSGCHTQAVGILLNKEAASALVGW